MFLRLREQAQQVILLAARQPRKEADHPRLVLARPFGERALAGARQADAEGAAAYLQQLLGTLQNAAATRGETAPPKDDRPLAERIAEDPEGVLALSRIGVATRLGFPPERLDSVLQRLSRPDRVELFEIEPVPISSQEIRDRVRRGESIDGLVPPAVAELIEALGLYRDG